MHVALGSGAGERHDARPGEVSEKNLRLGFSVLLREGPNRGAGQDVRVCGEGPETLVDDPVTGTPAPQFGVISALSIKPVLDHRGFDGGIGVKHSHQIRVVAVADAQLTGAAGPMDGFHRLPDLQQQ